MLFDPDDFDALGRALSDFEPGGVNALIAAVQEDEKLKKGFKGLHGCKDWFFSWVEARKWKVQDAATVL
ncbi:hypothetical protein JG688_00006508 [Phytophthora aleatoria]|uniref:Uncharacterized protein n=1 Tax=Phytophthora aleatoria TaxID=2496075 RepID=A0A8J5IL45_9STRA|nr:hypothetical protein JG688_00006508 [Phytophthora aleatoria]